MHWYILSTDIVKICRQILIRPEDQTFQHIFWCDSPTDDFVEFQLCIVTYSVNCALYLTIFCLHELDIQDGHRFPLAKDVFTQAAYFDDIVIGADTEEQLRRQKKDIVGLLHSGACVLSKWTSNRAIFPKAVLPEDRIHSISFDSREEHALKVLDLYWDTNTNKFAYNTSIPQISSTKRHVLSVIARLIDLIGALGLMILWVKSFMQLLWCNKLGWDELQSMWQQFCTELPLVFDLSLL